MKDLKKFWNIENLTNFKGGKENRKIFGGGWSDC